MMGCGGIHGDTSSISGEALRDEGMDTAIIHADAACSSWSEMAYSFLLHYICCRSKSKSFQAEDLRLYATNNGLPEPPSLRSWGAVISRAARAGVIERTGYQNVKNRKAHCTPASTWAVA